MALTLGLVQALCLLSAFVSLPAWSFWALAGTLITVEIIGLMVEQMNGDIPPSMQQALQIDPNVLQALNALEQVVKSGQVAGVCITGVLRDGNTFAIPTCPPVLPLMRMLQGQLMDCYMELWQQVQQFKQMQRPSPIIRPPPHIFGSQ